VEKLFFMLEREVNEGSLTRSVSGFLTKEVLVAGESLDLELVFLVLTK
jgi:hypothetical protein